LNQRASIQAPDAASPAQRFLERVNPVSGEVVTRVAVCSVEDARHAANLAAAAFPGWSTTAPAERRSILMRAAGLIRDRREEFARLICAETGGTMEWSLLNCELGASIMEEAAAMTTQIAGDVIPANRPNSLALAVRQPCGVVLSLAPWNAPIVLGARAVAMPLACGNTVVLKASELCPGTHQKIVDVLIEAGLPRDAVVIVHNAQDEAMPVAEALIAHPAVRRVNFTGSTRSGRVIAELCARHLKRCLLELGGKAPLVVLDDADLDEAARAIVYGAYINQGQVCSSTERVIVHEDVADALLDRLVALTSEMTSGDPRGTEGKIGPMISEQAAQRVRALIDDAVAKGARLVAGGTQRGLWLDPALLDGVTPDMRIYHEETFGPVASVIRFYDIDEAVSIANDTEYGLAGAVFGRDVARALDVARRLETGICHINGATVHDEPQMPFGGMKASGYGRFGGRAGIEEFTELRWITIQNGRQDYPM
jgi:vanillin dehydrogenase